MIKLTKEREATPYGWVHPDEARRGAFQTKDCWKRVSERLDYRSSGGVEAISSALSTLPILASDLFGEAARGKNRIQNYCVQDKLSSLRDKTFQFVR
jgi:hypothetical protein